MTHPTPDPLPPPPPPTPSAGIYAVAEALGFGDLEAPARQGHTVSVAVAPVSTPGGPVDFPLGSGRTPGLAVSAAPVGAVGGSGRGAQLPAAGVDVPASPRDEGRAHGSEGAATFTTPVPLGPPRFGEGRDRPVGQVDPLSEVVGVGYDGPLPPAGLPWSRRAAWRMASQPIRLGEGPPYDSLPKS